MKKKCVISIMIVALALYAFLPQYKVKSCAKFGCDNYTESTVKVQTYGSFLLNPKEIVDEFIRVNGMLDKLTVELYIGNWKYRTVVYDCSSKSVQPSI